MGFQQGLSGLSAASRNLDVIGHNIANANTTGMKSSRAEFSELYASSLGAAGGTSYGLGVEVGAVTQQFTQGNLTVTGNNLDLAINGSGFYQVTTPEGGLAYTRAGAFKLDQNGNIVTSNGSVLMGYKTDSAGNRLSFSAVPLQLPTASNVPAKETTKITGDISLDASAVVAASAVPVTPLATYGTSITAYDQQGLEVPVGMYFQKTANNTWNVYTSVNGSDPTTSTPFSIHFNDDGTLDTATVIPPLTLASPNDPSQTFTVAVDFTNMTQYNTRFSVSNLSQDGYTAGQLSSISIAENGTISARYSNGQTQASGQIALVNFRNEQGLASTSSGYWVETYASGVPVQGAPGEGEFGSLRAGALEDSNVDITAELVNMMTAQRSYQANAQTIKTQDQVLSTLVNLR